eukprot:TRINITY_DN7958_c0_g1_i3.p1 TRINITY_DN7958_c0_g1~~TRINITY_DN7958_c0_g1_i3.p1  ORF type:complete len:138 (-),score=11.19 TRINITY_DN7958_c0_g1_i3:174-587(-)
MTLQSVSLSFFILVFFLQFYGVDSYSCESQVRNCASIDTKCIYTGYKLTDEERFRLRPNVSIPGPAASIPLLFDNNINTTFRTGVKPVQGKQSLQSWIFTRTISFGSFASQSILLQVHKQRPSPFESFWDNAIRTLV